MTMDDPQVSAQSLETDDPATSDCPTTSTIEAPTDDQPASNDTTAAMPPGGKPRSNTLKREADLSSLLNAAEKTELTSLVTKVTELMLKQVTRLFDPIVDPAESAQPSRIALWNQLPYYLKDLTLGGPLSENRANRIENVKPSRSKKAGRAKDKGDALPTVADAAGEEATDGAPRLQELKKDVLQHFRKWQTAVHRRIGEISVKKGPEAQPRQFGQSPFGPKRRPSPNKRGKLSGM
jgi:hypothetical protein